jgi:hypothetical protein
MTALGKVHTRPSTAVRHFEAAVCTIPESFSMALRFLVWLAVAYLFASNLLHNPHGEGWHHDAHYFRMHDEYGLRSMREFGQVPSWNPYYCGGTPGLANPQVTYLAPDFFLRLVWGGAVGRKLTVVLALLLGLEGMYRLARAWRIGWVGAIAAAAAYSTNGWFRQFAELGWLNFLVGFELLPWVLLAMHRSIREPHFRWRWAALGGFFLAWMLLCGGTYTAPIAVVCVGWLCCVYTIEGSFRARLKEYFWRPWATATLMGLLALGLSAFRTLPMLALVREHPRLWLANETAYIRDVVYMLTNQDGIEGYVGKTAIGLATLGLLLGVSPRRGSVIAGITSRAAGRVAGVSALFFAAVSVGDHGWVSPYHWINVLPLFEQLREPLRYTIVTALFVSLAAGACIDALQTTVRFTVLRCTRRSGSTISTTPTRMRWGRALGVLVASAAASYWLIPTIEENRFTDTAFSEAPIEPHRETFRQARGNRWDAHVWIHSDRGSLQCFEETPFRQSPELRADLVSEEYALDPSALSVTRTRWTPNAMTLSVVARKPGLVVINQNYHRYWRSSVGKAISHKGLLAVEVPEGEHTLVLRFVDPLFWVGATVTFSLMAIGAAFAIASRRGRRYL